MDDTTFAELMAIVMLLNVPPQAVAAYLFWRWRSNARRQWMRNAFLLASVIAIGFVALRTVAFFLYPDDLMLRLSTAVFYVAGSYLMITMFFVATRVMERRMAEERAKVPDECKKSSDIIEAVISEMRSMRASVKM
ncbi:MAG: hypothetical protein AB7J13_11310 [Pyrinomonadaceae bacterium]